MTPLRVCVTGPDGAGKSTLVQAVVAGLDARHGPGTATHVQIWDSLRPLIGKEQAQQYLGTLGDRARALLLLHAVARVLELGERSGARVLVLDGYWYKYAVSELEHGAPPAIFASCGEVFPTPDRTWVLDVPLDTARDRKSSSTAYERGFASDPGAFAAFQARLRGRWAALEASQGPWHHLAATDPPEALAARVLAEVEELLAARGPA